MHIKKFGISENSRKNGNSDYLNNFISSREFMKTITYKIPHWWMEYTKYEIQYVKNWNKLFFGVLLHKVDFTTQTRSNTLKTLLEESKWKYWYVLLKDEIVFQVNDYWKDKRMQSMWADEYLRMLFGQNEKDKEAIKTWFDKIFNEFIEGVSKIEWAKIEYKE